MKLDAGADEPGPRSRARRPGARHDPLPFVLGSGPACAKMCVVHEEIVAGWRPLGDDAARVATLLSWNVRDDWRNAPDRMWFRTLGDLERWAAWLDEVLPSALERLRGAWLDGSRPAVLTRFADAGEVASVRMTPEEIERRLRQAAEPLGLVVERGGSTKPRR